jgi:hypothetical protein
MGARFKREQLRQFTGTRTHYRLSRGARVTTLRYRGAWRGRKFVDVTMSVPAQNSASILFH